MHSLITSYLLQTDKCALPNIGFFKINYKSAETDIVNKQMLPPVEEVVFNEQAAFSSPGLINYIAVKRNIPPGEAENLLNNFCKEWEEKIKAGEALCFESFGCLQKNEAGMISFTRAEGPVYCKPVNAERVLHDNTEHAVLVGDRETTSTAMNEYYKENILVAKRGWIVRAAILSAIALAILVYCLYNNKIGVSRTGNRNHFSVKSANETHFKP